MLQILVVILVVTFVSFLYLKFMNNGPKPQSKKKNVPGLPKTDKDLGNLPDVFLAGSFPGFLRQLHEKYGPIASYWHKDVLTVSLADPKYFKITEKMFDRHPALFEFALPLISSKSMQFLNGDFGRKRYKLLSAPFGFSGCAQALDQMKMIVKEDTSKWKDLKENNEVALHEEMMKIAINIITKTNFGCHFDDERNSKILNDGYEKVMTDFDDALLGLWSFGQGDSREIEFENNLHNFKLEIKRIVEAHTKKKNAGDYDLAPFLDAVLDNIDDEDDIIHQAITFLVGGFHTSETYMTWFFYNLGLYPDIQDRVRREIKEMLKGKGLETMEDIEKLPYTKRVMDESLRHVKVATFSARQAEKDVEIDGYVIPKDSQILNSLCITLDDKKAFPNPDAFDPDNFQDGQSKGLSFSPFGFGIRKCPGYRFANVEVIVAAVEILSRYKIIVKDKENVVQPVYGFITKPEKEVWICLEQVG